MRWEVCFHEYCWDNFWAASEPVTNASSALVPGWGAVVTREHMLCVWTEEEVSLTVSEYDWVTVVVAYIIGNKKTGQILLYLIA